MTALLLIAVCAGLGSCGDDELDTKPLEPVIDEITISDTSFDFEANGGEETLSFSTNRDWTVSLANTANGENWCTVTPLNGKQEITTFKSEWQQTKAMMIGMCLLP